MLIFGVILVASFHIGPTMGGLIPVQDEGDPWRTSFVFGVEARYGFSGFDLESELLYSELQIDPDSSRGFTYSMVPLTMGVGRRMGFFRYAAGPAVYAIEARKDLLEELEAVWKGTFGGMYLSLGRDIPVGSNTLSLKGKANVIKFFEGLWFGVTTTYLF
jgi:hypothetical protein